MLFHTLSLSCLANIQGRVANKLLAQPYGGKFKIVTAILNPIRAQGICVREWD